MKLSDIFVRWVVLPNALFFRYVEVLTFNILGLPLDSVTYFIILPYQYFTRKSCGICFEWHNSFDFICGLICIFGVNGCKQLTTLGVIDNLLQIVS